MASGLKYVLLVCGAPYTHQSADTALKFAQALIATRHTIAQVFFYHDGVYAGSGLNTPEQAERDITQGWAELARSNAIELVVCSHSAMKRGILDQQTARQNGHTVSNLDSHFKLAGLGQFVDAVSSADRLVSFGQGGG